MKTIILSPTSTGKSTFLIERNVIHDDVVCGEFISSSNYFKKGIRMGVDGASVPSSHPLYKSWEDIYKIGVEEFYTSDFKYMIYNCCNHIPYLKNNYSEIVVKIVMVNEEEHYNRYIGKIKNNDDYNWYILELIENQSSIINPRWDWNYILSEREEYKRLSQVFHIPIYNSFEEACD